MLEFCGGSFFACIDWAGDLSPWERVGFAALVLGTLFVILRVVFYICKEFD